MTGRIIVHLDADAFFASVEQAADPRLRGKPVAVGGERRGIVASASYEARRFGVYTPMPTVRARQLCPKLIVVPGDFEKYERFSRWMFSYAYDFTPDVEIGSIDEGFFDLTCCRQSGLEIARTIRSAIGQALKITVSEGIASNKLVSQIASKLNKPAAFYQVPAGCEISFLHPLPNRWLPGVGPKTAQRLNAAGLARIQHISATPAELLHLLVGSGAMRLREFSRGIDDRPVVPASEPAKSYGQQKTFSQDQTDEEFIEAVLRRMADHLMAKVREDHKAIRTLTVKVRYNDMAEDQAGDSLLEPTDLESDLYGRIHSLLQRAWRRRVSLRLVSLKLSHIYDSFAGLELPLDLSARQHAARRRLASTVDGLRRTHGEQAVFRGHDFTLAQTAARTKLESAARTASAHSARRTSNPFPPAATEEFAAHVLREQSGPPDQVLERRPRFVNAIAAARPRATRRRAAYLPLEVHSYYTFLDSTLSVEAIVRWAVEQQLPAVALTDTGNLHGAVPFVQAARAAGIKPILGTVISVEGKPLRLYVETARGYGNLCSLLSSARSLSALERYGEGLIAVGQDPGWAHYFPQRFYLETSDPADPIRGAIGSGLPRVAIWPVHYARREDRWKFDIVQSIRTLTLLRHQHPEKRLHGEFHFRLESEVAETFSSTPDLMAHTMEIAERCSFDFQFAPPQFPQFNSPDGSMPREFLRQLVFAGARRRYAARFAEMSRQLNLELSIISEVGYEEYFLVMWDLLQECRRRGIEWITRGSAADSLVCYCLEISDVCPVRFDLYFRRFLNKERMALNKLPDIDVDFAHDRKDDVIDLIFAKYGWEHTAAVGGFSTYQGRSALADVAKVLGVSEYQIRRITERLPYLAADELTQVTAASRECADLPLQEEPYRSALQMAQFLSGFPRHPKMHPCGVVLSRQPMRQLVPTFISNKGYPTTHFDMDAIEAIGLVKMDILAQGGLAVLRDVKRNLAERGNPGPAGSLPVVVGGGIPLGDTITKGSHLALPHEGTRMSGSVEIDLHGLEPWTDPRVWEMIAGGGARAVHHIESPAMISLCRMCNVRDIDTLIAIVSVIRPGAANENRKMEFARRYQGLTPTVYPHPSLETCLRSTFGLVVYEEHILQICEAFAGLPPGRADVLRRALAKEKTELIAEISAEFTSCARRHGRSEDEIERVWELVRAFRGYAFCKAHSTAYGVEAYEAAWLKRYYPAEFMAGVLSNGKGFYHPLVYVLECHRLGILLLPPSVNEPGPGFIPQITPEGRAAIRVPATRVKGLNTTTRERLVTERGRGVFSSGEDFYRRVLPSPEDGELLLRAGAFDCFGKTRTAQFWECQLLRQLYESVAAPGQGWLFPPPGLDRLPEATLEEPGRRQRLEWEAELFDFPVTGHPLELYDDIAWETYCPVSRLGRHIGERVVSCGLVIEQRIHHQVTGEAMKFLTLADWTGIVETELFAPTYRSYGLATVRYPVLEVTATVEPFENGRGFSLRVHRAGKARKRTEETPKETENLPWIQNDHGLKRVMP